LQFHKIFYKGIDFTKSWQLAGVCGLIILITISVCSGYYITQGESPLILVGIPFLIAGVILIVLSFTYLRASEQIDSITSRFCKSLHSFKWGIGYMGLGACWIAEFFSKDRQ
jgi:hypothetical protein